jgi:hypothetical protein
LLFADNAKLYFDIKSINDANRLQSNLNNFFQWSERNLLPLNISKCQVISFSRNKNPTIFQYQINNHYLDRVYTVRDLGIYFENDLSFKLNHSIIINKSLKMLGFINRSIKEFKNSLYFVSEI